MTYESQVLQSAEPQQSKDYTFYLVWMMLVSSEPLKIREGGVCAEENIELLPSYSGLVGGRGGRISTPICEDTLARRKEIVVSTIKLRH